MGINEEEMISSLNEKVYRVDNASELEDIKKEYSTYDHPYPKYFLGSAYGAFGKDKEALYLYISAAGPWLKVPNEFWSSAQADTIGGSIARIIMYYDLSEASDKFKKSLYALGFAYLSKSVEILRGEKGKNMMDSLFHRGSISGQNEHHFDELIQNYLGYGYLSQVMSLSDFYLSHLEYVRDGNKEHAKDAFDNAERMVDWLGQISVGGKPANEYTYEELTKVGVRRNDSMYENMKADILDGKYNLECEEFRSEVESSVDP
jgi:hypothetical protein